MFQDIHYDQDNRHAGVAEINTTYTNLTQLNVTGVDFMRISNGGPVNYNGVGGVFLFNKAGLTSTFTDVLFQDNYSWGEGGIARVALGNVIFNDVTVRGNYTRGNKNAGAFTFNSTGALTMNGGLIEANRTGFDGGVFALAAAANTTLTLNNVVIRDNWAGRSAGVFLNNMSSSTAKVVINLTAAGGTNNYLYSGNIAGNASNYHTATPTVGEYMINNNAPAPLAKAGGFYRGNNAAGTLEINVESGITLAIGTADAADMDTLATNNAMAHKLNKLGGGDLVLNANNAYFVGNTTVAAGRLLLGNAGAQLGGSITVSAGATFGGSGTVSSLLQNDTAAAASLTAQAGAALQIGAPGAVAPQKLYFARTGSNTLTLSGGVILNFDLFGSDGAPDTYNQLIADQLVAGTGTNIIAISNLGTADSYTLISSSSFIGEASNFTYTLANASVTARNSLTFEKSGQDLLLNNSLASLALTWTGSEGMSWINSAISAASWTDGGAPAETHFNTGDAVIFDATADSSHRGVTVAAEGVTVSGMKVAGDADYTFDGGVITVDAGSARPAFTGTTGKLEKSGTGAMTLANAGNNFGRIEIAGGAIVFSDTAQLGAGADEIRFTGDGMLRTAADGLVLANRLESDANRTGAIDTNGNTLAYAGVLAGSGTLAKIGAGVLRLTSDNAAYAASFALREGTLLLDAPSAKLGGIVTSANGTILGGSGEFTGTVNLVAGAILQIGVDSTQSTLGVGTLNFDGGTLAFDLFDGTAADKLNAATLGTLAGGYGVDVSSYRHGSRPLATINAGDRATFANSAAVTVGGRPQSGLRQLMKLGVSGNDLIVTGTSDSSRDMKWTGAGSTITAWDDANANWTDAGAVHTFAEGDRVTFDAGSPGASHAIAIAGTRITVSDMVVQGNADYRFTGAAVVADPGSVVGAILTGAQGKLTKDGSGKLTLANDGVNAFKGGIDLKAGTLALEASGASGTHAINLAGAAATLQMAGADLTLVNAINLGANTLIFDTQAFNATLQGSIAGSGSLIKTGAGTLTLDGASTHTGVNTLSAGVLALGHGSALGADSAKLAVGADGAAVRLAAAGLSIANAIDLGAHTLTLDALGNTGTFSGIISGAGGLTKIGAGTVALSGSNTFSGPLAINEGVVSLRSANALGAAQLKGTGVLAVTTGNFAFASTALGGGFTGTVAAADSGHLALDANAAALLSVDGAVLRIDSGGVVQKASGNVAIDSLALNGGLMGFGMNGQNPDGILTVDTLDLGSGVSSIGLDTSALLADIVNPPVPPDPNILDLDNGVGGTRLVAATTITGAGTIVLTSTDGSAIPTPAYVNITQSGDTVARAGYNYTTSVVTDGSGEGNGVYMGYGLAEIGILDGKTLILDNGSSTDSNLSAKITGPGGLDIRATGSAAVTLTNAGNDYTGATTLSSGTLRAGAANVIATSSGVEVKAGAVFDMDGFAQTVKNLAGAGSIMMGTGSLTVDTAAGGLFSGGITGSGKLIKTGAGRLSLTGSSAYTGGTELAAGELGIGHSHALGTGALTVTAADVKLAIEGNNLTVVNAIAIGGNGLAIDSGTSSNSVLAGVISGAGAVVAGGNGEVGLAGANTFSGGLAINSGRVFATGSNGARAIGTAAVTIAPSAVLEFRGVTAGAVNNTLGGDTVEFTNSTLALGGANTLQRFIVGSGARITASSTGALGGVSAAVTIGSGGELGISPLGTVAGTLEVKNGGKLIFNPMWRVNTSPMLTVDSAIIENGASIGFGSFVSGDYLLLQTAGTLSAGQNITFDPGPNVGLDVAYFKIDPDAGTVSFGALNYVANPGKDIAAMFDAMTAAGNAIYSRVSEGFLFATDRPAGSFWLKGIGSYASYDGNTGPSDYVHGTIDSNAGKTGYANDTYGIVAGFDRKVSEQFLAGAYVGCLSNRIRTDDRLSENEGTLPFGGAYGALRFGTVYLAADLMFGSMDADTSRFEQTGYATGAYKTSIYGASIEAGTILGAWDKGAIKPAVALHYTSLRYRNQDETGPGSVLIDGFDIEYLESLVSLQVTQEITLPWKKPGVIDGRIGWRGSLKDSPIKTTGRFLGGAPDENFAIAVDQYNRNGLLIGLGLRFGLTEKSDFSLGYDFELGSEFNRHTLEAAVRFIW
ncbi:hypothetical protein AW736_10385 [Termitidicoccus mucosus]|uniref:Autotransporter domain-containing protein n=1 Tax=Termitidicoccus mucosus TaxID=1184151 RepID=A0A178IJV5_9BACT|nr:hypothetical protein AW736_10385 [Opitutaceae bacterium TSB47]